VFDVTIPVCKTLFNLLPPITQTEKKIEAGNKNQNRKVLK